MRYLNRSLIGLFLVATTAGFLALGGGVIVSSLAAKSAQKAPGFTAQERVIAAKLVPIDAAPRRSQMMAFGEVRAHRALELRSPGAGKIVEISPDFQDGGLVTQGQLLLRLDPADALMARDVARVGLREVNAEIRDAQSALVLVRADLDAARAQEALRRAALTRQEDLEKRGVGSPAAVESAALNLSSAAQLVLARRSALAQAEARIEQADLRLSRAQIALEDAERRLADTELRASFSGRLSGVSALEGRLLSMNERLGEIIDPAQLDVAFRLSTAQFLGLLDAQGEMQAADITAELDVGAAQISASGALTRVSASVGEGATGRLVYAQLDDAKGFRPGDFVTVLIDEPPLEGAARIPASALGADDTVLVLGEGDRLSSASVDVLRRMGDEVLIDARPLDGREIIAARSRLLGAGIKVRPVRSVQATP